MKKIIAKILIIAITLYSLPVNARSGISIISDAQTQKFLEELSCPLIKAAKLDPDHIKIYIVNDSTINAFVTQGQNIFINTGLITKFKTPDSLIGVISHEVGHIASGHLARSSEEYKKAQNTAIVGYVLGIAAMIAGSPGAAQGLLIGGTDIAQKSMLKYTRSQEESADKNALTYLNEIKYPSDGLRKLLESFELASRGIKGEINEYLLSHPVSKKRIDYLNNNKQANVSNVKINKKLQPQMDDVLAKLEGFMDEPYQVIKKYEGRSDRYAKYALSIAYFRDSKTRKALKMIDDLIKSNKDNGFFYEFKAQILYETGFMSPAIVNYKKAIDKIEPKYAVDSRLYLAKAILNITDHDQKLIQYAIDNLLVSKRYRASSPFLYRQLYIAYNKLGNKALSSYNHANYNYLLGKVNEAYKYAKIAKKESGKSKDVSKGDKLKIEDLIEVIKDDKRLRPT